MARCLVWACSPRMFSIFRGSDERNSRGIFVFGIFILFLALHNLFTAPYAYTTFLDINWLWGIRFRIFIYLFGGYVLFELYVFARSTLFTALDLHHFHVGFDLKYRHYLIV